MESIDCGRSITETKRGVEGSIMKTLVKNGMIVSPEDTYESDVLIEDGVTAVSYTHLTLPTILRV